MDKYKKYNYMVRNIMLFTILINIVFTHKNTSKAMIIYLVLYFCLLANDYLRHSISFTKKEIHSISLLFSIAGGSSLAYLAGGYTDIYIFMIIYEIIMYSREKISKYLLVVQVAVLFFIWFLRSGNFVNIFAISFWQENGIDLFMLGLFMAFYILSIHFMKLQMIEKRKVQKLNEELKESYDKLQEYSLKIEELIISKERNRMAQEIHDSIGHFLTALIMHIDFVEKVIDKDTKRTKELIVKIQDLARNSMNEVRKAVYALKENSSSKGLLDSINELKENLTINKSVDINYDIKGDIEELSPDLKNILYRTIQEALTNGIKHGNATEFVVTIYKSADFIELKIKDNGAGCSEIKEGNGLRGIRERIAAVYGNVKYNTNVGGGFIIDIYIPLKGDYDEKNKVNAC